MLQILQNVTLHTQICPLKIFIRPRRFYYSQKPNTSMCPSTKPWYQNGLKFKCTTCGACCTWEGDVWVTEDEMTRIANYLKMDINEFAQKYVKFDSFKGKFKLKHKRDFPEGKNTETLKREFHHCVFLQENRKCAIYPARPIQCSTYPFWSEKLRNERVWNNEKWSCEGIDHPNAELIPYEEIEKQRRLHEESQQKSVASDDVKSLKVKS
jgi:Fe-S-cluster containining protein